MALTTSVTASGITDADLERVRELVKKSNALNTVDIGYCMHEYPAFEARIEQMQAAPGVAAMHRLAESHGISESPPDGRDSSPSEDACNQALSKAEQLIAANAEWLDRLAGSMPAQD
jgi:hypothetical protein